MTASPTSWKDLAVPSRGGNTIRSFRVEVLSFGIFESSVTRTAEVFHELSPCRVFRPKTS